MDDQFGRILRELDRLGLAEDTIAVFTSDHGNCLGAHEEVSKNVHYEESMRVPFLIRWRGRIPARRDDLLLATPDIAPTLLGLMGLAAHTPDGVQGADHSTLLLDGRGPRPTSQLYIWIPYGGPAWGRRGVRTERYTCVVTKAEGQAPEYVLHDNVSDPAQLRNVAGERPNVVRELVEGELEPWLRRTRDPWLTS